MAARIIPNNQKGAGNASNPSPKVMVQDKKMQTVNQKPTMEENTILANQVPNSLKMMLTHEDRAKFYTGHERLDLQSSDVQRVRELQEENDNLQRESSLKEKALLDCRDPLSILAEIEHLKTIVARNTGEILKIYLNNEERIKRIRQLKTDNEKIQKEMMDMQGKFISTKDSNERTKWASEFFILKNSFEKNSQEIDDLSKK